MLGACNCLNRDDVDDVVGVCFVLRVLYAVLGRFGPVFRRASGVGRVGDIAVGNSRAVSRPVDHH